MDNQELYHYGVKGMKWGVRKSTKKISSNRNTTNKKLSADDLIQREKNRLSNLSRKNVKDVSNDDRLEFAWDVEGTEDSHLFDSRPLSSKNVNDVKRVSKELTEYYDYNLATFKNEGDIDTYNRAKKYRDTYASDMDAYAKAVIESIEDVRQWRDESVSHSDELQHHGTKGMRWGIRRYQNKDGSLTPAGQKRYNKEVEKLKAETAKVKAAEKVAATRAKTQSKIDKLEAEKQKLEERKKALKKGNTPDDDAKKKVDETPEQRRERLLKSSDPKELFEGKDALTTFELNERLQRIDLESRLQGKIPVEQTKTGKDYINDLKSGIDTATSLYKSVDNAYSTVANSALGKTLAKTLGIELPNAEKKKDYNKMLKNLDELSPQEMMDLNKREMARDNLTKIKEARAQKTADKKAEEARKAEEEAAKKVMDSAKDGGKYENKTESKSDKSQTKADKKAAKEERENEKAAKQRQKEVDELIKKVDKNLDPFDHDVPKDYYDGYIFDNEDYIRDLVNKSKW